MRNGAHSRPLYVYNKTRETFVATEAVVADTYIRRLVGLLGKTKRWAQLGRGLWIVPSSGVHTIGMMFPIDLIFLNYTFRAHQHFLSYSRDLRFRRQIIMNRTTTANTPAATRIIVTLSITHPFL